MEGQTSPEQRIEILFESDLKPIVDHFINIGIAAALVLGAVRDFKVENSPSYLNDISLFWSYVIFAIASVLLIIKISFPDIYRYILFQQKN